MGALFLSACTGDGETTTSRSQAPPPTPLSAQAYGTTLSDATGPLESALKDLNKAKTYKGLTGRVSAVEKALTETTAKLNGLTPPTELTGEHPQLIAALQKFQNDLSGLSSQVGGQELCTGPTVRTALGDADGTAALRDTMKAVQAKLPGSRAALSLPSAGQKSGPRPSNGEFIRSGDRGGRGTLTIDNGGSGDAVVTLSKGRKAAASVYVRKGKKYTVNGVNDGTYTIFFTGGSGWDGKARAFGRNCAFQRFDETVNFRTVSTATQIRWSTWKITLQPVAGGNARTTDVDPNDFPE